MGDMQYRDTNRELVMKLAEIHRSGVDAEKACAEIGIAFDDPADICRHCARKIVQGSIEGAVKTVRQARLDADKAPKRLPSHEVPRRRDEAADNKTAFDDEVANDVIASLESERNELQEALVKSDNERVEAQAQLDGALARISELQNAQPVVPEPVTAAFLAQVLRATPVEVLDAVPHLGGERISDIKDWATATLE